MKRCLIVGGDGANKSDPFALGHRRHPATGIKEVAKSSGVIRGQTGGAALSGPSSRFQTSCLRHTPSMPSRGISVNAARLLATGAFMQVALVISRGATTAGVATATIKSGIAGAGVDTTV